MVIKTIDCYEVIIKMLIRKDYWYESNGDMTKKMIEEKVQQGIEVPIDEIGVTIKK